MGNVSDFSDPELDAPGSMPYVKETKMTDTTQAPQEEAPEVKPFKLAGPINIKGQPYEAGDEVMLTEEEHEAVVAAGVLFEGDEPKTEEELQAAHEEGAKALKAEYESRAKEEAEKEARDEAHEKGEEFDEAKFNEEYDRQQKVANPDYEAPAPKEKAPA
jgi:negative regulator of genetic competence, sporulation and motility